MSITANARARPGEEAGQEEEGVEEEAEVGLVAPAALAWELAG